MKKLMIICTMILLGSQANAQKNYYLSPVKIDDKVSVSLPKELDRLDTLGQQTISANGSYGSMLVIRANNPAKATTVKNESGLNDVFTNYIKNVKNSLPGATVLDDHNITIGKLQARDFILQVDSGDGIQSRHIQLLYTKDVTYTFEYLYDDYRKDVSAGEAKAFFGSIKVTDDMTTASQYITTSGGGLSTLIKLLIAAAALAVIVAVVLAMLRNRKPQLG